MNQAETQSYRGGLPYAPDVRKLDEAFPTPEEDQIITHEELQRIIDEQPQTQRFYGVINAWKVKLMSERNIDSEWIPGTGVKILPPADRQKVSESDFKRGIRKLKRAGRRHAAIPRDRLDEMGQRRFDHAMQIMAKMKDHVDTARRELAIDLAPVKSLPKPKLVNVK